MSYFNVTILGCGSATPTLRHMPSSQIIAYRQHNFLMDCGEGTQLQLRRYGISFARINHIFLSHLHGDHFLGLPGLLSTMALHDVQGTVTVHTFAEGAQELARLMNMVCPTRPYELKFNIVEPKSTQTVFEDNNIIVTAFPLYHRVPCVGYRFEEKPKLRHIDGAAVEFYGVPHYMRQKIKEGADFVRPDGSLVPNERLTTSPSPTKSYAYCSDTAFNPAVAESVKGIHTVYHESTYGDEQKVKASSRGHATAREAGRIAAMAGANTLILGHYSKTITDESLLAAQAAEEFGGTVIAGNEGIKIEL